MVVGRIKTENRVILAQNASCLGLACLVLAWTALLAKPIELSDINRTDNICLLSWVVCLKRKNVFFNQNGHFSWLICGLLQR
jgi:hypothetical protein